MHEERHHPDGGEDGKPDEHPRDEIAAQAAFACRTRCGLGCGVGHWQTLLSAGSVTVVFVAATSTHGGPCWRGGGSSPASLLARRALGSALGRALRRGFRSGLAPAGH